MQRRVSRVGPSRIMKQMYSTYMIWRIFSAGPALVFETQNKDFGRLSAAIFIFGRFSAAISIYGRFSPAIFPFLGPVLAMNPKKMEQHWH